MKKLTGGSKPGRLLITGGASANPAIAQVYADVFQCPVFRSDTPEGAAFGAAVRALHGSAVVNGSGTLSDVQLEKLVGLNAPFAEPKARPEAIERAVAVYEKLEASLLSVRSRM